MWKQEFDLWKSSLSKDEKEEATGFFNVIKRRSQFCLDEALSIASDESNNNKDKPVHDLFIVPYSQEYRALLTKAAELLHKAGNSTSSPRYG